MNKKFIFKGKGIKKLNHLSKAISLRSKVSLQILRSFQANTNTLNSKTISSNSSI